MHLVGIGRAGEIVLIGVQNQTIDFEIRRSSGARRCTDVVENAQPIRGNKDGRGLGTGFLKSANQIDIKRGLVERREEAAGRFDQEKVMRFGHSDGPLDDGSELDMSTFVSCCEMRGNGLG